jgi:hypothetical protein
MTTLVHKPDVALLRRVQRGLMDQTCLIANLTGTPVGWHDPSLGRIVYPIPCRTHQQITNADSPDPEDADTRSLANWRFTVPHDVDVRMAYRVQFTGHLGEPLEGSVGEELDHDTWKIATRFAITNPKLAVPQTMLVLWRDVGNDGTWVALPAQPVRIVYDRLQPEETQGRFSPAAFSSRKGGRIIGPLGMDVTVGDRFKLSDAPGIIVAHLPGNPDITEVRFTLDIGGA